MTKAPVRLKTTEPSKPTAPGLPAELLNISGTAAAILAVVATGAGLCALAPTGSVWITAAAYAAPAAAAFGAYWWVSRRL